MMLPAERALPGLPGGLGRDQLEARVKRAEPADLRDAAEGE